MDFKLAMFATGPLVKYRFDLLNYACPEIVKNHLIVLTDDYSRKLYSEYENIFNFVSLNNLRHEFEFSKVNEPILERTDPGDYAVSLQNYYNRANGCGRLWSYDLQRFLLRHMLRIGCVNFAIVDTDFIINSDINQVKAFFDNVPSGSLYTLFYTEHDTLSVHTKAVFFHKEIQPFFPSLNFAKDPTKFYPANDWIRGFHFKNTQDLELFFNVWNKSIEVVFKDPYWYGFLTGGNIIWNNHWMWYWIAQYFQSIDYKTINYWDLHKNGFLGIHHTRPEDTFYWGNRDCWKHYNFDHSDTSSIAGFVKNNKNQLKEYYGGTFPCIEITDTHVYTSFECCKNKLS